MQLPEFLVNEVFAGRVVLCLGAGASMGATTPRGDAAPNSDRLRELLADKYLGGEFKGESLAYVAELAISEHNLFDVQDFVADQFRDLAPAPFHGLIPTFRWRAIYTTNFDTVIEQVYRLAEHALQQPVTFLSDSDRVEEKLRLPEALPLVKLHGCITRTHDPHLPLILTVDQYNDHRLHRSRLFSLFESHAAEYSVVFIGQRFQDADIRALIAEASRTESRPRFYLVRPGLESVEARLLEARRIGALAGTFEEFLDALDHRLPRDRRTLSILVTREHPIERLFTSRTRMSESLGSFLDNDAEFVHAGIAIEQASPAAFYKGFDLGWYAIASNLDVRRRLADTILREVVYRPEGDRPTSTELYAVLAEAGAGKTVLLRRVAWDAAQRGDILCLFARPHGIVELEPLVELWRLTNRRIFLFVDNAADCMTLLSDLYASARRAHLPLTILTAERQNIWNQYCDRLDDILADSFILTYLSESEIATLVDLLERSSSLGPHLEMLARDDRIAEFRERAGRQLLVALHEATQGIPFEEIIVDEFNQLQPLSAKSLYLTVCVLHRLGTPVRAGLISRVHGITFNDFHERFLRPLEHVVKVERNFLTEDYYYTSRHQEIAQIIFDRILQTPSDRFNEFSRIIKHLSLLYSSDRASFRGMVRAKALLEIFPSHEDVKAVYATAKEIAGDDVFLLQQMANYERIRPNGNLVEAERLLTQARAVDPSDATVSHSLAEVLRARAEAATNAHSREALRAEARKVLQPLLSAFNARYAYATLLKIGLDELRDLARDPTCIESSLDSAVRAIEATLTKGLQRFPNEPFLLTQEADFARLVGEDDRVLGALQRAHEANPRDPYVAARLSRVLELRGRPQEACDVIHRALDGNRGDKLLNYRYAMLLRASGTASVDTLVYHLNRAFTKWDGNYEAQFWYARYAFESSREDTRLSAVEVFQHLREVPMAHDARTQIHDVIGGPQNPRWFAGIIDKCEATHGFVAVDDLHRQVFFHQNGSKVDVWSHLRRHCAVRFHIGFSYSGPEALELELQ
jgi:tetratricopeptide (TPR) repeat protein